MKFCDPEKAWFEVWYSQGVYYVPAFLVVVTPNPENQNEVIVINPAKNEIIYRSQKYEDICDWLTEDEFIRVDGREFEI